MSYPLRAYTTDLDVKVRLPKADDGLYVPRANRRWKFHFDL